MTDDAASYDAIVLYYRLGSRVRETISMLQSQTTAPRTITLVDNASGDGVAEHVAAELGIDYVLSPSNEGYGSGMNVGARSQSSDAAPYTLFLTHEVELDARCVERMIAAARTTAAAVVGPTLRLSGTLEIWSTGGVYDRYTVRHRVDPILLDAPRSCDWIDGAVVLTRSSVFNELRGFDERFFMYWEDVDYCARARRFGDVIAVGDAEAYQSTKLAPAYWTSRNAIIFARLHSHLLSVSRVFLHGVRAAAMDFVRLRPTPGLARLTGLLAGSTARLQSGV